jgi:hypothetical protein
MYLLIGTEELVHRHNFGQDDTNRGHQRQLRRIGMANPTTKSRYGEQQYQLALHAPDA